MIAGLRIRFYLTELQFALSPNFMFPSRDLEFFGTVSGIETDHKNIPS